MLSSILLTYTVTPSAATVVTDSITNSEGDNRLGEKRWMPPKCDDINGRCVTVI